MAVEIDIIEGASLQRRGGLIVQLTRIARVSGLGGTSGLIIDAVNDGSLPEPGDAHPDDSNLVLVDQDVTNVTINAAWVTLTYRRINTVFYKGGESLVEIKTANDRMGNQIKVYTISGENYTLTLVGEELVPVSNDPDTVVTAYGGEITPLIPQTSLIAELVTGTEFPGAEARKYVGKVNLSAWQGAGPKEWLCTRGSFEPLTLNTSPPLWTFDFEFVHSDPLPPFDNSHDPEVYAVNPETGLPFPDLIKNIGYKRIIWHESVNFAPAFPG